MTKQRNLTASDKKEIKNMTRFGFVLPSIIIVIAGIINLYILVDDTVYYDPQILYLVDIGVLLLCIIISYLMNRKHYKDLKTGVKKIHIAKVTGKDDETSYEAGGGTLYIPILGDLFPKLWGHKSKPNHLVFLIIDNYRYRVNKELYDIVRKGESVEMHYSIFGNSLLKIEKSTYQNNPE